MHLTDKDITWWKEHTDLEIQEQYNISSSTITRTKKKHGIKTKRKTGSGRPKTGTYYKCKKESCNNLVYGQEPGKHYCSKSCYRTCEKYLEKMRTIDRSYMYTEEYSKKLSKDDTPEYKKYAGYVHRLSEKVYQKNIDIINPNRYPRTVAGVDGGYQLDHIIEIRFGFDNNIPPEVLCEVENLRMLPWKENLARNKNGNS